MRKVIRLGLRRENTYLRSEPEPWSVLTFVLTTRRAVRYFTSPLREWQKYTPLEMMKKPLMPTARSLVQGFYLFEIALYSSLFASVPFKKEKCGGSI